MAQLIGRIDGTSRRAAAAQRRKAAAAAEGGPAAAKDDGAALPASRMPAWGWKDAWNLRGPGRVSPPAHRVSSRTLGAAYPFLAQTGQALPGAYLGEDMLSRTPFCFDPWALYAAGAIRSHSACVIGVKGSGKSVLAKCLAVRLARMGILVAVPHDPNGEWTAVADWAGGKHIRVGPGLPARINLMDPGDRDPDMGAQAWRADALQYRRATVRAIVRLLRDGAPFTPWEHTALDLVLEGLDANTTVTLPHVFDALLGLQHGDIEVAAAAGRLGHTLRRVVRGDLAGLFDGPSTVSFDASAPIMSVDTSALKGAAPEAQALARLATANWVRRSTLGGNRARRLIVHEEAAVELLNDVAGGAGLASKVEDEKTARHLGTSNWYLLHRIADLDALGDAGSALHSQALGLLADCDTRVCYAQHAGELGRTQHVLGLNDTITRRVRKLGKGEGVWQIGEDRTALVRNIATPGEMAVFATDRHAGARTGGTR